MPGPRAARSRLFIDLQHGLSNRLRALASAAVIAGKTGRELVVIWRPDAHCEARAGELLQLPWPVIEDDAAEALRAGAAREYNYMEIEPGSAFDAPILDEAVAGDVYVRSAYTLRGPHFDIEEENRVLRGLRPVPAVTELVASVGGPFSVAAHVRMATGPAFDHLAWEGPENWPEGRHRELSEWRRKSDIGRFVDKLDQLVEAGAAETIFVAADLAESYAVMEERYGARLRLLRRDLYDRSPRQVQYALADLILLTAAPLFLESTMSAFSEVAQRLAWPGRPCLHSGIDF